MTAMRSISLTCIIVVFCCRLVSAQANGLIDSLDQLLFPIAAVEKPTTRIINKDSVVVTARDFAYDMNSIFGVLERIREKNMYNSYSQLLEIIRKHEEYFQKEWEYSPNKWYRGYNDSFETLMGLEMTLTHLYIVNHLKTSDERYSYWKNLHLFHWGDRDSDRGGKLKIHSHYLRKKALGCYGRYCSIDLLYEISCYMYESILNDIKTFESSQLSDQEDQLIRNILPKSLLDMAGDMVEDIIISRSDDLRKIAIPVNWPDASVPLDSSLNILYFIRRLFVQRERAKGVQFVVNKIFETNNFYGIDGIVKSDVGRKFLLESFYSKIANTEETVESELIRVLFYYVDKNDVDINRLNRITSEKNQHLIQDISEMKTLPKFSYSIP